MQSFLFHPSFETDIFESCLSCCSRIDQKLRANGFDSLPNIITLIFFISIVTFLVSLTFSTYTKSQTFLLFSSTISSWCFTGPNTNTIIWIEIFPKTHDSLSWISSTRYFFCNSSLFICNLNFCTMSILIIGSYSCSLVSTSTSSPKLNFNLTFEVLNAKFLIYMLCNLQSNVNSYPCEIAKYFSSRNSGRTMSPVITDVPFVLLGLHPFPIKF